MGFEFTGKLYDEFEINKQYYTSGRTVTETDIVNFAGLSGDFCSLHMNEEYAKNTIYGSRIAYGVLTFAISTGLVNQTGIFDGSYIGLVDTQIKYSAPVRIGDTITCVIIPVEKRLTKKTGRGLITFKINVINQKAEIVAEEKWVLIIATSREYME